MTGTPMKSVAIVCLFFLAASGRAGDSPAEDRLRVMTA